MGLVVFVDSFSTMGGNSLASHSIVAACMFIALHGWTCVKDGCRMCFVGTNASMSK